jgi:hypothetical protein
VICMQEVDEYWYKTVVQFLPLDWTCHRTGKLGIFHSRQVQFNSAVKENLVFTVSTGEARRYRVYQEVAGRRALSSVQTFIFADIWASFNFICSVVFLVHGAYNHIDMALPCLCHVFAMSVPCLCHVFAMLLPCLCHVFAMSLPCVCHVFAMSLPWFCHVFAMSLACLCHIFAMLLPCLCHAFAMLMPLEILLDTIDCTPQNINPMGCT